MKKLYIKSIFASLICLTFLFSGCYMSNYDDLSTFEFQLPLIFHSNHYDKAAPDVDTSFSNLFQYKEYKDNIDKIKKSEVLHFNYWINELVYRNKDSVLCAYYLDNLTGIVQGYKLLKLQKGGASQSESLVWDTTSSGEKIPDPYNTQIVFPYIRFYLVFATPKAGVASDDTVSSHWSLDTYDKSKWHLLGEFLNVSIVDYYKNPEHIQFISDEVGRVINEAVKNRPQFFIITEYSPVADQNVEFEPKRYFPLAKARYDMVIKFKVDL